VEANHNTIRQKAFGAGRPGRDQNNGRGTTINQKNPNKIQKSSTNANKNQKNEIINHASREKLKKNGAT